MCITGYMRKRKAYCPYFVSGKCLHLQYNKGDITKILSCIAEGVAELRKSEFNKYSPLLYQINSGGEIVPLTDSITAYFTKNAAEDALNAVSK